MKKKILMILATAVIAVSAVFSGCSCSGDNALSFKVTTPEYEKAVYTVKYQNEYLGNAKKTDYPNNGLSFTYGEGSFVTELKQETDISGIKSDIKDLEIVTTVYSYTTEFTIPLKVKIGEKEYDHTEKIITKTYIAGAGASLAPLYSKEEAEYFMISANEKDAAAVIFKSETETFYDKSELVSVKKYKDFKPEETEITLDGVTPTETETKYDFRSAIDNAELLFALRGLNDMDEKASKSIKVISPEYKDAQGIKITNDGKSQDKFTINGKEENVAYNTLSFRMDDQNKAGTLQYVKIQSAKSENLENNAYLLEYAKPLIYYGSFSNMGWLVFTVSEIA